MELGYPVSAEYDLNDDLTSDLLVSLSWRLN